jgi:hypothetical protein
MNNPKSNYRYTIRETPDSLIIQYRGSKSYAGIILMSLFLIIFLVLLYLNLEQALNRQDGFESADLFYIGLPLLYLILIAILSPALVLHSLSDHETITITDHAIRIEKSGFRSVQQCKKFPLKKKSVFHLGIETRDSKHITFYKSKAMARISRMLPPNPMRYFCSRISPEDGLAILERIGTKFPRFDVLKYREFNLNTKPG